VGGGRRGYIDAYGRFGKPTVGDGGGIGGGYGGGFWLGDQWSDTKKEVATTAMAIQRGGAERVENGWIWLPRLSHGEKSCVDGSAGTPN
jgi:hypothetical protein